MLTEYNKELEKECFDLLSKVVWLIETYPGWGDNDSFTFPNGDTWREFKQIGRASCRERV